MAESCQPVWFDDEKPTASDVGNTVEITGLTDSCRAIRPPPAGPQVFLVLATDEPLEVDSPDHIPGFHEIERRKRNADGRGPALLCNAPFVCPTAIPAGITV